MWFYFRTRWSYILLCVKFLDCGILFLKFQPRTSNWLSIGSKKSIFKLKKKEGKNEYTEWTNKHLCRVKISELFTLNQRLHCYFVMPDSKTPVKISLWKERQIGIISRSLKNITNRRLDHCKQGMPFTFDCFS